MDDKIRLLLLDLAERRSDDKLPDSAELKRMAEFLEEIQRFSKDLSIGDLATGLKEWNGPLAGNLKALHANLRHLTWQAQMIAQGHFDQRVEFMGDFSNAFNRMAERLRASHDELRHVSTHDALTGLYNRGYFDTEIERRKKGRAFPVSVIMADIDGLKNVNDTLGHVAGDQLLRKTAGILERTFRGEDIVARIGGDEFAVILPEMDERGAALAINRVRASQEAASLADDLPASLSMGAASAANGAELDTAIRLADSRMYLDKAARKKAAQQAE